jgi:hypothetical protein
MPCKYAIGFPVFILIIIHFIILHPIVKQQLSKLQPIYQSLKTWFIHFVNKNKNTE